MMPQALPQLEIDRLTVSQRLELITLLWDSIPDTVEALALPEWHRQELERRLASANANPSVGIPWDQVKGRLRDKP
jgi:putative addiction module component (TIGR02574 family)